MCGIVQTWISQLFYTLGMKKDQHHHDHSEAQEIHLLRRILETLERIERELKPRIMTPGKPTVQVKE